MNAKSASDAPGVEQVIGALTVLGPANVQQIEGWVGQRPSTPDAPKVGSFHVPTVCEQLANLGVIRRHGLVDWVLTAPPSLAEFDAARGLEPPAQHDLEEREDRAREWARAHMIPMLVHTMAADANSD